MFPDKPEKRRATEFFKTALDSVTKSIMDLMLSCIALFLFVFFLLVVLGKYRDTSGMINCFSIVNFSEIFLFLQFNIFLLAL